MTNSLLAWTTLAAVHLIPFELRSPCPSTRSAILRGILGVKILSFGVIAKLSFLYFIVLIVPILFLTRLRDAGTGSAFVWLIAFVLCSALSAFYTVRYGRSAFVRAAATTSGGLAVLSHNPLLQLLSSMIRESPGLGAPY